MEDLPKLIIFEFLIFVLIASFIIGNITNDLENYNSLYEKDRKVWIEKLICKSEYNFIIFQNKENYQQRIRTTPVS